MTTAVAFTDKILRRFLTGLTWSMVIVVVGVAAIAFYTSFEAIKAFAATSGGINPDHAWMVPLLVDSFIFIASAADLWLTVTGLNRTAENWLQNVLVWSPKALLALAALGSFSLNLAHAEKHVGARVVAILAPVALVLTFEILMMIVRRAAAARVERLQAPAATWTDEAVARIVRRAVAAKTVEAPGVNPHRPPVSSTPAAAAATEAGPPPRSRPVAQRSGTRTLDKAHRQALYRAHKEGGAEKVEQVRVARGLPASAVPERWALPSPNGTKQEVRS